MSGLAKLGKAANKVETPSPTGIKRLELPKKHQNLDSSEIVPNPNGGWDVKQADGTRIPLANFKSTNDISNKVFILRSLDIPKDPKLFKQIPEDVPIYISGKNDRIFSLSRGAENSLNYKNISLKISNTLSIQKAIYHLEKPLFSNKTRFVNLSTNSKHSLESTIYGSKIGVETSSLTNFTKQLDNLKHQSIVLSGSIENGIFYSKSSATQGIPLNELRKAADKNGINLAILESNNPSGLLKLLSKREEISLSTGQISNHSIGDFFDGLSIGKNSTPIKITSSADGRSNVAIQFKANATKEAITQTGDILNQAHLVSLLVRSASIYRPNEIQDAVIEQERRAKIQKQNLLFLYPFLSLILGWTSGVTSRFFWAKIWNIDKIELKESTFLFHLKRLLNKLFFVILFLPLLGIWCFQFAIIKSMLKIMHTILIKPVVWLYTKFT